MLNIFDSILNFMAELSKIILPEYILYASIGVLLLTILICLIVSSKTYEVKVLKFIKDGNSYFKKHPHIGEDNLIYVNNSFKKSPKNVRYAWQQYMLNRDKLPSDYVNTEVCVDQPLKSSAHDNTTKVLHMFTIIIAALSFLASLSYMLMVEKQGVLTLEGEAFLSSSIGWMYCFITPILTYILGAIVVIILRARHTAIVSDVYTEFHDFERYLNKACTTLPAFIDYEVLFTRKEIRDGIPALQEYLEKRALEEQKEKEEKEISEMNFEEFSFEELGVENSLLIERALRESEKFFNVRAAMSEKISAKQTEMSSYQKNFDEVTKEYEKKAQAFKESLKQINDQLNSTSVNIEVNYLKKRYREDQQKLQQLEKDYEIATIRFNKQQAEIDAEVGEYRKTIESSKNQLHVAMTEEGKSYANKIYGIINKQLVEQNKPIFEQQNNEIAELQKQVDVLNNTIKEKQNENIDLQTEKEKLNEEILTQKSEITAIKNVREYLTSPEFRLAVVEKRKSRRESGIDQLSADELRDRAATAEEQLKIANAKQAEMEKNEDELMKKLRRLEENEKILLKEVKSNPVQQDLANVNKTIAETNNNLQQSEEELAGELTKTLSKLDEGKKEQDKEKKKSNLSSLMNNVNKLKKKK